MGSGRGYVYFPRYGKVLQLALDEVALLNSHEVRYLGRRLELLEWLRSGLGFGSANRGEPPRRRFGLFLNVANDCNLACVYCFAACGTYGKRASLMSPDLAAQITHYCLDRVPIDEVAHLIYFGGEPLLAWDAIVASHRVGLERARAEDRRVRFSLVTNGVLLCRETIDFLIDAGITITISIDGGEEIQNRQRPMKTGKPSFAAVTQSLSYLLAKSPRVCAYSRKMSEVAMRVLSRMPLAVSKCAIVSAL